MAFDYQNFFFYKHNFGTIPVAWQVTNLKQVCTRGGQLFGPPLPAADCSGKVYVCHKFYMTTPISPMRGPSKVRSALGRNSLLYHLIIIKLWGTYHFPIIRIRHIH